ncbi:porin [Labrys miyagiensis]|uniref:Porin n=1 Tax=Labrys miyagiensis TaxID=346912 RepID=A0ABQ6CJ71_9HYPH|nr:outer membrane protein [Labrys miyagiensis]GLS20411.1 porin [Labrys miyagiensis]
MIKNLLATTALAVVFAGLLTAGTGRSAVAADLALKPSDPSAPLAATPFDWTGPYIGLHAGYGWGREHDDLSENGVTTTPPPANLLTADHFNLSGFVGGAHAGYNYQFPSQFVVGVEGDIDYTDLNGSHRFTTPAPGGKLKFNTNWQASARLRAGYAIDNLLLYATGGVAFSGGELKLNGGSSDDNTHIGWTIGAGAEYAFTPNWIGRVEVRYSDFNKQSYNTSLGKVRVDFNQTTATVGVSYKF